MTVLTPRTPAELARALVKNPSALPLAGGTDLMVGWNMGALNGRVILDLSRLDAWRSIRASRGSVLVGALATHSEIQAHAVLRERFPLLTAACATVGAAQIQNRGTLGGNIANASPAADSFPALCVYEAIVHVGGASKRRLVPVLEIFSGVKKNSLRPGELIEAVELPFPVRPPSRALFRKVGTRAAQAISKTVFAGLLWLDAEGRVEDIRLAFGSMAPTVRRLRGVEEYLRGRVLDGAAAAHAGELMEHDVSPIDDMRSTREYRLTVSRNLLVNFLQGAPR
jgi:CO/xanthine dehydrogenase FAD-binding subunit